MMISKRYRKFATMLSGMKTPNESINQAGWGVAQILGRASQAPLGSQALQWLGR